jgi:hypothetical protein
MFCAQCGNPVAEGSAACPRCGAPAGGGTPPPGQYQAGGGQGYQQGGGQGYQASGQGYQGGGQGYQQGGPAYPAPGNQGYSPNPGSGGGMQSFNFNASRLSQADRIAGAASVVLLISLFLPWFSVSILGISASASGTTVHGYLWLVFILCLAIVAFLVFGAGFDQSPVTLPVARETLLLAATGINLLLVLLAFFFRPGAGSFHASWDFGAFIGLIAAIAACASLAIPVLRSRTGN